MRDSVLEFAIRIARKAGRLINNLQPAFRRFRTKSTRIDLVTRADHLSEEIIISAISKKFPEHKIISEEQYCNQSNSSRPGGTIRYPLSANTWIIDPLDGTTNYAHRFPFYCVSVALSQNNNIILGVVYDPNRNELFYATRGKGAYLWSSEFGVRRPHTCQEGNRLRVSKTMLLSKSLLATGFPYIIRESPEDNFTNFERFCLRSQAIRRAGSAALDLCYLAAGRLDGFWERELKPWDTAAGALILTEAGGKITDFKGNPYSPFTNTEILASNKYIHQQMLDVIRANSEWRR
ncbi:MAG: inositol monophosphatase family protein [Planctomycetota bacterium]|nr:inositol monophosphatase family protein [Planctomycetota bacterium]MDI6787505.1 inositol monophosphatase family protein [Planctomycetota bacterium]